MFVLHQRVLIKALIASAAIAKLVTGDDTSYKVEPWGPASGESASVQDLRWEYRKIFRRGNRNAASHRWATFLLDRSDQMTEERLVTFFEGFCAVSGSPVRPSDYTRYRLTLPKIGGGHSTGYMHYCCWPCVCDTQDYIRVDTLNVTLAGGESRQFQFAVIGNPCDNPAQLAVPFYQVHERREITIAEKAKEVHCLDDGTLEGATVSDHGYIIVGMFFDSADAMAGLDGVASGAMSPLPHPTPGRMSTTLAADPSGRKFFQDEREYQLECEARARAGYNSGMGDIFRKVCEISPITLEALQGQDNVTSETLQEQHNIENDGFEILPTGEMDKMEKLKAFNSKFLLSNRINEENP